jgi:hypothetical protein
MVAAGAHDGTADLASYTQPSLFGWLTEKAWASAHALFCESAHAGREKRFEAI